MRRMLTNAAAFAAIVTLATPACADVCELTGKASAQNAVRMLSLVDVVLHYCGSCGDAVPTSFHVGKAEAVPLADDPEFYQVRINGAVTDIAYVYYLKPGTSETWVNLGTASGCDGASSIDVAELPPGLAEKAGAAR